MRTVSWKRSEVVESLSEDIWRYLTQTAVNEDGMLLAASRLLQMPAGDVERLAQLHFVLSQEVKELLLCMPRLSRRLATTSTRDREVAADRVRGPINWSETYAERAASGMPHLFVSSPARRAFDTAENQMLRFVLDAVAKWGRRTGWEDSTSKGVGSEVRSRVGEAARWSQLRALQEVPMKPIAPTEIARVRSGRRARTYAAVIEAFVRYQELLGRLDRRAIREAIEGHALITREDPVLLELLCTFKMIDALKSEGWKGADLDLMSGGKVFSGSRDGKTLTLYYQHTPNGLKEESRYRDIQKAHGFSGVGGMIPDMVVEVAGSDGTVTWIMVEVKGVDRTVASSARAATRDLLSYRRAFDSSLGSQEGVYGIGIAWGSNLEPAKTGEIILCSPDAIRDATAAALC